MRQVVLDTETTGLDPASGDRVIEVAAIEIFNFLPTGGTFHRVIDPERDVPEESTRIHGFTYDMLRGKPRFADVAEEMLAFIGPSEIIAHNAPFDFGFLDAELVRAGRPKLDRARMVDSLDRARRRFPGQVNSLDALCDRLEVDNSGRKLHGALLDAELLADVYINMTRGQEALLIDAGDASTDTQSVHVQLDLRTYVLPVLKANAQELAAHDEVLAQLDKSSGGKTVWRQSQLT